MDVGRLYAGLDPYGGLPVADWRTVLGRPAAAAGVPGGGAAGMPAGLLELLMQQSGAAQGYGGLGLLQRPYGGLLGR